jgi:hypothetical protein
MGWNSGSDPDAIHDNVSGEISAVTEKTTPVDADLVLIEDSAGGNVKRKAQVGNLPGGGGGGGGGGLITPAVKTLTVEITSDQVVATAGAFVDWDQTDSDSDAPPSAWNSANPSRLVAWETGWYLATGTLEWETTTAGDRWIRFQDTAGKTYGHYRDDVIGTNFQPAINAAAPIYLAVGDYIEVFAGQDDGVNRSLKTGSHTRATLTLLPIGSLIAGWSPILDYKPTSDPLDDEFNGASLDAKWTAVTGAAGTVDLLETGEVQKYDLATRGGWLLLQAGSAANQKVELRQDVTLADGDSVILALSPTVSSDGDTGITTNELWAGISLNDNDAGYDAGEYNTLFWDVNPDGWRLIHSDGTTAFGTSGTSTSGMAAPIAGRLYLRFMRVGSVIHAFWSNDGSSWMALGSETRTATATNLWIFCESTAAANEPVPIVAVDWIRQGTNNLDPWSHSGLVQLDTVPDHVLRLDNPLTSGTDDDEFDDDTIDAAWTSLTVTGSATWTEQDDVLSVVFDDQTAGDAAAQIKSINGTPAAAIEISTAVRAFTSANHGIVGMFFSDGTTATSNLVQFRTNVSDGSTSMYGGTFTDIQNTLLSSFTVDASSIMTTIYMRLTWVSSNTWRMEVSPDGVSWTAFALADQSHTLTPTHYGLYVSSYGGTVPKIATFEYFRSDAP